MAAEGQAWPRLPPADLVAAGVEEASVLHVSVVDLTEAAAAAAVFSARRWMEPCQVVVAAAAVVVVVSAVYPRHQHLDPPLAFASTPGASQMASQVEAEAEAEEEVATSLPCPPDHCCSWCRHYWRPPHSSLSSKHSSDLA